MGAHKPEFGFKKARMAGYMDTPADRKSANSQLEKIVSNVTRLVGSLASPDYSGVKLDSKRYSDIVTYLSDKFWIRDVSEPNMDISSVLHLRSVDDEDEFNIYLSNVGNYMYVIQTAQDHLQNDKSLDWADDLADRYGMIRLTEEVLSTPVKATMFYADEPKLFNILFSDTDFLPWEKPKQ